MMLEAVDVSLDLIVHRSIGLKQKVESQQHPSQVNDLHFRPEDQELQELSSQKPQTFRSDQAAFCIAIAIAAMSA